MRLDEAAVCLKAYRSGFVPENATSRTDGGIRLSDAYVAAHDPLDARVALPGEPAVWATVALGVDPGTYFCGGLALALAGLAQASRCGFIHVPNDRLLHREDLLALTGLVVARSLDAFAAAAPVRRVLLTGFGHFSGVPDNPTEAFVRGVGRWLESGERVIATAVLTLANPAGEMHATMAPVLAQFNHQLAGQEPFDAVIGLGVDSQQKLPRPRFTIETQSRGMREGDDEPGPFAPLDELALAWLAR